MEVKKTKQVTKPLPIADIIPQREKFSTLLLSPG